MYVGLEHHPNPSRFVWADGSEPVYTNWAQSLNIGDCVVLSQADAWKWQPAGCNAASYVLVEKEANCKQSRGLFINVMTCTVRLS